MISIKRMAVSGAFLLSAGWIEVASATAFDACPTHAFLMQGAPAKLYSVDLATGFYQTLADNLGTNNVLNAMAYNFHDNYLYAYSKELSNIVRIHSEYNIENLNVSGMPDNSIYVGDISLIENVYYFYRPGSAYGLYRVDLDPASENYLQAIRIIDGGSLNLGIYDFATHPVNNGLYAVDKSGNLHLIDVTDGSSQLLGNVGVTGVFGAAYFDEQGTLYISRNSDGYIFRINVTEQSPSAEFFANGPSSSKNDGARCALASLIGEQSTIDFGDAPESYGTSLENNGARHNMVSGMSLGDNLGGDDDGISLVTGLEQGMESALIVEAKGEGYLNVWVDWNQNQTFDDQDQAVQDKAISEGNNLVVIDVPVSAQTGSTWLRARYSSTAGIAATGGVSDGEVEDIEVNIAEQGSTIISYPGTGEYTTLAYEDHWPMTGDYDMNDVVVAYRTHKYVKGDQVTRYVVEGKVLAHGASFSNGFAVQLDGVATSQVNKDGIVFKLNGQLQPTNPLEDNAPSDDAVLILADNLWNYILPPSGCRFYRTEKGCDAVSDLSFYMSVPVQVSADVAPSDVLNPFVFGTPGGWRSIGAPGRGLEIHLKNKKVSSRFNFGLFGSGEDRSSYPLTSFLDETGMPWALELPSLWDHPVEGVDLVDAYPQFIDYVLSMGGLSSNWYMSPASSDKVIVNY